MERLGSDGSAFTAALALACLALGLGACQQAAPWSVPHTYVIQDVDDYTKEQLTQVLGSVQYRTRYGFHLVTRGQDGEPYVFMLKNVKSLKDLREVQDLIQDVSRHARVPVVLQEATLTFASVYGGGQATIEIRGTATPGAEVVLDVGNTTVRPELDAAGRWTVSITSNAVLSQRGGWVYGVIRKGNAEQFLKMNALDTRQSERILPEEVPFDSLLRRTTDGR